MTRTITIRLPRDLEDKLPPPSTVKGEGVNAWVVSAIREKLEKEEGK